MPEFTPLESGPTIEVSRERGAKMAEVFAEVMRLAEVGGDHVWTAVLSYYVPNMPEIAAGKAPLLLDAENLAYGPATCCFRCEEPYSEALRRRRCKGEPRV